MTIARTLPLMLLVMGALAGCAPSSRVMTSRIADLDRQPGRLFVMSYIGDELDAPFYDRFKAQFGHLIAECGIAVEIATVRPTDRDVSDQSAAMQRFAPEKALSLKMVGGSKLTGMPLSFIYRLELMDPGSNRSLWDATYRFSVQSRLSVHLSPGERGDTMAGELVDLMKTGGVLRACPPAPPKS